MRTSDAEAQGFRCPSCGDATSRDTSDKGFVRHMTNRACGFGHGERDDRPGSPETWASRLVAIVEAADRSLNGYWSKTPRRYSGRHFDAIAAQEPFDRFTAADLYACSLLSAEIDGHIGADILDEDADTLTNLLRQIPTDVSIRGHRGALALADDGPASALYGQLRDIKSIGPTRASKLLAVKRPGLVPIRDSFVEQALGAESSKVWWQPMLEAWEDPRLGQAVDQLRREAGPAVPAYVTDLRLLDVAVWLSVEQADSAAV